MTLLLFLLLAADAPSTEVTSPRFPRCVAMIETAPEKAVVAASEWRVDGGGIEARQCLGLAYIALDKFGEAATTFTGAAESAASDKPDKVAPLWAQAGNAWLLAGNAASARAALDKAIALGGDPLTLGEAHLDRARAVVAMGDQAAARADLDAAIGLVPADPMAWLLSATLARRLGDLPRARNDIAEALKRDPYAADILIESGNIAIMSGDLAGARAFWSDVVARSPGTPQARAAAQALNQNPE